MIQIHFANKSSIFNARLDGYYRFSFDPNSRSGLYLGIGAGYFSSTIQSIGNPNSTATFQYLVASAFAGMQFELAPPATFFLESGVGYPFPIVIPNTSIGDAFGLLLTASLATLRLNLGFNFYF